jgi:hypothetical protein
MLVHCDRCKKAVEGCEGEGWTGGFYDVSPGTCWSKFARPYETVVCDECMWADPAYIAIYGVMRSGVHG